jgi:hypothetical protein
MLRAGDAFGSGGRPTAGFALLEALLCTSCNYVKSAAGLAVWTKLSI